MCSAPEKFSQIRLKFYQIWLILKFQLDGLVDLKKSCKMNVYLKIRYPDKAGHETNVDYFPLTKDRKGLLLEQTENLTWESTKSWKKPWGLMLREPIEKCTWWKCGCTITHWKVPRNNEIRFETKSRRRKAKRKAEKGDEKGDEKLDEKYRSRTCKSR